MCLPYALKTEYKLKLCLSLSIYIILSYQFGFRVSSINLLYIIAKNSNRKIRRLNKLLKLSFSIKPYFFLIYMKISLVNGYVLFSLV